MPILTGLTHRRGALGHGGIVADAVVAGVPLTRTRTLHLAGSELGIGQNSAEICESRRPYVEAIEVAGTFEVGRSAALTESQAFDTCLSAVLKTWSVVSNE